MIVGFNHNISYRGTVFHVQTEDSGLKKPQLITLLYHSGTIITSQKTLYADIIKVDNLDQVVEELAKDQHKGMLKRLTKGEFDERIVALGIPLDGVAAAVKSQLGAGAEPAAVNEPPQSVTSPQSESPSVALDAEPVRNAEEIKVVEEPIVDRFQRKKAPVQSLDELILSYLTAGQKKA